MTKLLVVVGLVLIVLSFLAFDGVRNVTLAESPKWTMFITGSILTLLGLVAYILSKERISINRKARIESGLTMKFNRTSVNLGIGKIQEISRGDDTVAVVLPANTTFMDDCIKDKNSALGAYMLSQYPDKISEVTEAIGRTLEALGVSKNSDNSYPAGTTIILPPPYNTPVNILITAATIRKEGVGIWAEPSTICQCIQHIFMITSAKKISKLRMPVLGSGHGGLEINAALLFLMLSIKHYASRSHHVKSIDIVVTENDAKRLKDIYKLQYLAQLKDVV
jgi:hypothetical protein